MDTITLPWLYFPDTHLKTVSMLIKQQLSISRDCSQSCQSSLCVSSFSLLSMACFIRWLTLLIIPQIFICIPARARTRARDEKWRLPFITPPLLIVLAYNVGSSACILLKENHFFCCKLRPSSIENLSLVKVRKAQSVTADLKNGPAAALIKRAQHQEPCSRWTESSLIRLFTPTVFPLWFGWTR